MQDLALILKKDGLLSDADFSRLEKDSFTSGTSLDELVEQSGIVDSLGLIKAKAKLYNVPFVSLTDLASSPEALSKIPESVAEHYQALPFAYDLKTKQLSMAMANPLDLQSIAFLEAKSNTKVKPFMAISAELMEEIPKRYSQGLSAEVSQVLKESVDSDNHKVLDVEKIGFVRRRLLRLWQPCLSLRLKPVPLTSTLNLLKTIRACVIELMVFSRKN
jgi:hypothetical protein